MCRRKTTQEFIAQSKKIFGKDAFDYSLTKYTTTRDLVTMRCNTCNKLFTKTAHLHLSRAQGCKHCSNNSLSGRITLKTIMRDEEMAQKPYRLYYIKIEHNNNTYYKIGIEDAEKPSRWKSNSKYSVELLYTETARLKSVFLKEQTLTRIHRTGIDKELWSYGGHTEMLEFDFLGLDS